MKGILLMIPIFLMFFSCEKENNEILIGKWRHVKSYTAMGGDDVYPDNQHQKAKSIRNIISKYYTILKVLK
jgi:GH43 family beta-xylosidase